MNSHNLLEWVFGCRHRKVSFPISPRRGQRHSPAARETGTYVVCLNCGKEFAYDWDEMRIVTEGERTSRRDQPLEIVRKHS